MVHKKAQGTGADSLKLALVLLWERRDECPWAVPVLVCHDELVVECDADLAQDVRTWLKRAMVEGMDAVLNGAVPACVPVETEVRVAGSWGERG